MSKLLTRVFSAFGGLVLVAAGSSCGLIAGVPSIGEGGGGGDAPVSCSRNAECDDGNPCTSDTCGTGDLCVREPRPDGPAPAVAQVEGDCKKVVCGAGALALESDDADVEDDDNDCTADLCLNGSASHHVLPAGAQCEDGNGNGGTCNKSGTCVVVCQVAADCVSQNPCQVPSCDTTKGVCVLTPVADDTPTPGAAQTAGDCHAHVCVGGMDVNRVDDTDVPTTPSDCDDEVCKSGVPSNPPAADHSPCSTFQGNQPGFCDGAGACVECADDADCSGPSDDCQHPVCKANGTCDVAFTAAMTPTTSNPPQTVGDCATLVCDGSGGTTNVTSMTDPQDDGQPCTNDVCTGVNMTTHTNVPGGSPCGTGGMLACWFGVCSGCMGSSQCPAAYCTGTVLTKAQTCSGMSLCQPPTTPTVDCAPYLCTAGACGTSCTTNSGCAPGNYCALPGGTCKTKLANGASCTQDGECQSGDCGALGKCQ